MRAVNIPKVILRHPVMTKIVLNTVITHNSRRERNIASKKIKRENSIYATIIDKYTEVLPRSTCNKGNSSAPEEITALP